MKKLVLRERRKFTETCDLSQLLFMHSECNSSNCEDGTETDDYSFPNWSLDHLIEQITCKIPSAIPTATTTPSVSSKQSSLVEKRINSRHLYKDASAMAGVREQVLADLLELTLPCQQSQYLRNTLQILGVELINDRLVVISILSNIISFLIIIILIM